MNNLLCSILLFSGIALILIAADCSTYPDVENADFNKDDQCGDVAIKCDKNFKMELVMKCIDGTWRSQKPFCKHAAVKCPADQPIRNSNAKTIAGTLGQSYPFTCFTKLGTSGNMTCVTDELEGPDGKWQIVTPCEACDGALRFAKSYGDHMVLQRGPQRAVIWGFADQNGETITAQIVGHGNPVTTKSANGQWKLKLPAMTSEGPFTIEVSSQSEGKLTLHDILFGDVWICSGQSNMGFQLGAVNNSAYELQKALKFTKVRIFRVPVSQSTTHLDDIKKAQIPWTVPTTQTVQNFSAVCFLFGEFVNTHRQYPIGLIESIWGGTPIEAWTSPDAYARCPIHKIKRGPHQPSTLWNTMIYPLLGMTIYGAIWYQGEANTGDHPERYVCQQPAMVNDWRQQFHHGSLGETSDKFPFGFVQLAAYSLDFNRTGGFPVIRFGQTGNVGYVPNTKLPHTFMAVAMDLPDFDPHRGRIHSRYKQDVAERLGLAGLAVAYGQKGLNYQGPYPTSFNNHVTNQLTIEYDNGHTVLDVRSNNGFEICCSTSKTDCGANDQWVAAPISHHQGASVTLNTSGCPGKHVVGLRYAWRESPCEFKKCAIYGRDNDLPGPTFIRNKAF